MYKPIVGNLCKFNCINLTQKFDPTEVRLIQISQYLSCLIFQTIGGDNFTSFSQFHKKSHFFIKKK